MWGCVCLLLHYWAAHINFFADLVFEYKEVYVACRAPDSVFGAHKLFLRLVPGMLFALRSTGGCDL